MTTPEIHYAWAAAFAFVGLAAAIAYYNVNAPAPPPPPKDAQIVCIEMRGKWIGGGWGGPRHGTCEFPSAASTK